MGEMQAGNPAAQEAFPTEKTLAQAKSQFEQSRTTPLVAVICPHPGRQEAVKPRILRPEHFRCARHDRAVRLPGARYGGARHLRGAQERQLEAPGIGAAADAASCCLGKMLPIWLLTLIQIVVIFLFGALDPAALGHRHAGHRHEPLRLGGDLDDHRPVLHQPGDHDLFASPEPKGRSAGLSNALLWVAGFLGGALIPSFLIQQIPMLNVLSRLVPQSWATRAYY